MYRLDRNLIAHRYKALTFQELELEQAQLIPHTAHKGPVKTKAYLLF
jgi:hypothetical protein